MASGGTSSEWLKISHGDTEGIGFCGEPEQSPQSKSDSPWLSVRGSNCALRELNSA